MIGDRDSVRELRGDSHRVIQEWVSDQLDGGEAHGQRGAALAGGAGRDTAVITSLNKAADLQQTFCLSAIYFFCHVFFHLRTVLVLTMRPAGAALAHGDGGELPGVTEHRGAGHVSRQGLGDVRPGAGGRGGAVHPGDGGAVTSLREGGGD